MNGRQRKGAWGETLALAYLQQQQHQILYTNLRIGRWEVDILSLDGTILVFTEVKTRSDLRYGYPETAVSPTKQAHIKQVASAYLEAHPEYREIRFDIISIIQHPNSVQPPEIHHIADAFY